MKPLRLIRARPKLYAEAGVQIPIALLYMSKSFRRRKRILWLGAYVAAACVFVYIFRPVYLASIFIVLAPPSALNFYWLKRSRFKILVFSLAATFIFAPPVELAARLANAWDVQSVLPRIFGIAPIENLIFAFFNFFWVLSFYEYFVDRDASAKISKKFKLLVLLYCLLSVLIFLLFFINRQLISLNYCVLSAIILLAPGLIIFRRRPGLLRKIWLPTLFFAAAFFVYEAVSLAIGSWWWPGQYLLPISLAGKTFPLDDVIIWYLLSTPILIGGYEFFMDDGR